MLVYMCMVSYLEHDVFMRDIPRVYEQLAQIAALDAALEGETYTKPTISLVLIVLTSMSLSSDCIPKSVIRCCWVGP